MFKSIIAWILLWAVPLLLLAPSLALSGEARAEEPTLGDTLDEPESGDLESEFQLLEDDSGVVESAARHRQKIGQSPSAITVITREDIEASGARSIPDLLRLVPGISTLIDTPAWPSANLRLNNTNMNSQYLVFIDGREANLELLGMVSWEMQPIMLDDIERIEIIRGPGSALYGANAMTGVMNISTRMIPDRTSGSAFVEAGEAGTVVLGTRASGKTGNFKGAIGLGADLKGSFIDPREKSAEILKLRAVGEYRFSDSSRLLIDGSLTGFSGLLYSLMGKISTAGDLRTARIAFDSDNIHTHLYWLQNPATLNMKSRLEYGGTTLAAFVPVSVDMHVLAGQIQWNLPTFWEPLLVIVGMEGRSFFLTSNQLLNEESFSDPGSSGYHQPGIDYWEARASGFVHLELTPTDWVTITSGFRLDYNTVTGEFLSPRVAAVFQPAEGHYIRMGVARSFRMPSCMESSGHPLVEFPAGSPLTGPDQDRFLEFMSHSIGNSSLDNEELMSFEVGYWGQFFSKKLEVVMDGYYNAYSNRIMMVSHIINNPQGMPDLDNSFLGHENRPEQDLNTTGLELSLRLNLSDSVLLQAWWAYRYAFLSKNQRPEVDTPKNLFALGGRVKTASGFIGSLYVFSRSERTNSYLMSPDGVMAPFLSQHLDSVLFVLARAGWRQVVWNDFQIEGGVKLFLPISPFEPPLFRFRDSGGGFTPTGESYGSDELSRVVAFYLLGSF